MYPSSRFVLSAVLAAKPNGSCSSTGTANTPRPEGQLESSKSLVIHADGVDVTCRNFHSFVNCMTVVCPSEVTAVTGPKISPVNNAAANPECRRNLCLTM